MKTAHECLPKRLLPMIDPDLIGPDDFRTPFARLKPEDPVRAFDLWAARRVEVDTILTKLKKERTEKGLDSLLKDLWGDPLPDLEALLTKLTRGTAAEVKDAKSQIEGKNLAVESFTRLMTLRDKDARATADPKRVKVTDEEWEEVYSLLAQAQKVGLKCVCIWTDAHEEG